MLRKIYKSATDTDLHRFFLFYLRLSLKSVAKKKKRTSVINSTSFLLLQHIKLLMWQRIQTVFLSLVVLSMLSSLFLPIWVSEDSMSDVSRSLYPLHYTTIEGDSRITTYFPYCATAILMLAAATIAIMEIRRYDDRIVQIKMGTLNSLILAGVMISAAVFANQLAKLSPGGWKYGLGLYLPFIGVTFNWLAIRFIRKDEKTVRDSDRIR